MSLLRLAVLGPPEVFRDGSRLTFPLRKAQALLLYLAVEGGMHPRSKLAVFLWPDSGPEDELTAKVRLFKALARLLDALAQRAPLVVFVDDLQWVDEASLDLLRYLGHSWKEHGSRVLWLCTLRSEELELNPQLSAELANLRRDLPVTQVPLQPLSQAETLQLIKALVGEGEKAARSGGERREHGTVRPSTSGPETSPYAER